MNERTYIHTRYGTKRASCDSGKNSSNSRMICKEPKKKSKSRKSDKFELTLKTDFHKNNNLSLHHASRFNTHRTNIPNPNHTHEQTVLQMLKESQNLSDLREEVEQLRMENESLREELSIYRKNEKQMQYRMKKMEEDRESDRRKCCLLMNAQEDKIKKYGLKIKQLYEELIKEKKKNIAGENPGIMNHSKTRHVRSIISPTLSSITNIHYFKTFQDQGEKQFYTNMNQHNTGSYQTENYSIDHSHTSNEVPNNKLHKAIY